MTAMSKTILVVDDRSNWRELLKAVFASSEGGYIVQTADSLAEAMGMLDKHDFGLVITNLGLEPVRGSFDRSGLRVVDKLQQLAPGTPCIVLTAFDETIREQVENYCARYNAPIWVVWKWGSTVYKDLKDKVRFVFEESSEDLLSASI